MSTGLLSRVAISIFASATALFVTSPSVLAGPPEWEVPKSCSGKHLTSDRSAEVESCIYRYEGTLVAYGTLISKTGNSTIDNCTMVVKVIDKDAHSSGSSSEEAASSRPMPCFNGSYPSPPLRIGKTAVKTGHHYVSYTEITKNGTGLIRIYSPELIP